MKKHLILSGFLASSLLAALTAGAQVTIFSENFDSGLSAGAHVQVGYTFGDTTASSATLVAGVGVGGTGGWEIVNTAASGANGFSGVGAQYQNGGVTGNTSTHLSDYTLSFDARATGGSLNIQVQTWTGAGFGGTMTGTLSTAPSVGFGDDLTLNPTFTHYNLNFADATIWHNGTIDPSGGTYQIAMQFNGGGATPYSNTLDVDNFQLVMAVIPEPSSLALLGLGVGSLAFLRRRQS
jgi:hypothetical protein